MCLLWWWFVVAGAFSKCVWYVVVSDLKGLFFRVVFGEVHGVYRASLVDLVRDSVNFSIIFHNLSQLASVRPL